MITGLLLLSTFSVVHSFLRTARQPYCKAHLKLVDEPGSVEAETALSPIILHAIYDWISVQNLDDFVSKREAKNIILEVTSNNSLWTSYEEKYTTLLDDIERKLQNEKRTVRQIIGEKSANNILAAVESTNIYEPDSVRLFLRTPAFETMIGGILYEGIFEFIQKVDIIGNIVNNLPIIGPIRQTILKEFKKSLDKTLGGQIKIFLASFNRVAVQRMADFILSPDNTKALLKANRNLIDTLLKKPIYAFLPDTKTNEKLRREIWSNIVNMSSDDLVSVIDTVYDIIEEKKMSDFVDFEAVNASIPSSTKFATRTIDRFLLSEMGRRCLAAAQAQF